MRLHGRGELKTDQAKTQLAMRDDYVFGFGNRWPRLIPGDYADRARSKPGNLPDQLSSPVDVHTYDQSPSRGVNRTS